MEPTLTEHKPAVLFVDDEENILRSLVRLTMDENYTVVTADSGQQGLQLLGSIKEIALIVSDQRMPGMNGAEFLEKSRELAPDSIRMLLTGYSEISAAIDSINKGGASRYLSKPWNDDELLQTLRSAVETWRLGRENRRLQAVVQAQNEELKQWNENLKNRVLQQTTAIRKKADDLNEALLQLKQNYSGMISAFSSLVEMRGPRMHRHSHNVAALATEAARQCGLMPEEQETIRIAALLHDIGEISLPDRMFGSLPESMSGDDLRLYCQHPVRAQIAIDHIADLRPAGVLIRHHHENFDGSGFPDRLAGEQIPLGARILAYADQLDRAFSGDNSLEQALTRVELTLETRLDPALKNLFRNASRLVYISLPKYDAAAIELELHPSELKTGMLLSRDLFSGTGLLLLNSGVTLDETMIMSIRRYYKLDPPEHGIFAFVQRG